MDRARFLDLLDAYLDQRLSEADRAAFERAELTASRSACRLFWEVVHQRALLAELIAEARGFALARQEQTLAQQYCSPSLESDVKLFAPAGTSAAAAMPETRPAPIHLLRPSPFSDRWRTKLWLTLTAALLLATSLAWLFQPPADGDDSEPAGESVLARLAHLHGDVRIGDEESLLRAQPGQIIFAGQEIRTGEGSSAVVAYADASRLELAANTAVQLLDHADREGQRGKRIFLVKGAVNGNVTPQPHGRPMLLSTNQADLLVPGTRFRSASAMGETRIELEAGKALLARKGDSRTFEIHTGSYAVAACDGDVINPVAMLPTGGEPYATLDEGSGPVMGLAACTSDLLAIACWNGIVKLWDLRTRQIRGRLDVGRVRTLALACVRHGRTLAVGYETRQKGETGVVLWNIPKRRVMRDLPGTRKTHAIAFTPDSKTLVFADRGQKGVIVWDNGDRRERIILGERSDRVQCLAVSPDGRLVAAGCRDGLIRLWNLRTGRLEMNLEGHTREVQTLAFQPGGRLLASGSRDGTVRLWSLPAGNQMRILSGSFKEVRCLTFAPDGQTLATGHGGTAVLWSVTTGQQRSTLKAHQFAITALVYLPDGRTLATAGWDRTVKLWDLYPAGASR